MDEVYDLLEPRKKNRQAMNVFINNGQVFIYDPTDRKNMEKMWRAAKDYKQAESFRQLGDANRTIRSTGMNPESSRGHTLFMCRFRKEVKQGSAWIEQLRSKISLVDLAGSERAHDTGLTGVGLEEGVAINQSLSALGMCLMNICKGKKITYQDKLTKLLSESLGGTAVTVMIAALSPADINYNDTLSTLRFADNAKKMPVKAKKQAVDPTAELMMKLKEENERLQKKLAGIDDGVNQEEMAAKEKLWKEKLAAAEARIEASQKSLRDMEEQVQNHGRLRLGALVVAHAQGRKQAAKEMKSHVSELESRLAQSEQRSLETSEHVERLSARIQELERQGLDAAPEKAELSEVLKRKAHEDLEKHELLDQERVAVDQLCDAALDEVEELQEKRKGIRERLARAKSIGESTDELKKELAEVEASLKEAHAECDSLVDQAYAVGDGPRFRAALKGLAKQDKDAEVAVLQEQITQLNASAEEARQLEGARAEAVSAAQAAALEEEHAVADALQEQMLEQKALAAERDAVTEDDLSGLGPEGEGDLRSRQEAISDLLAHADADISWEQKLAAAAVSEQLLKDSFMDGGISVEEIRELFHEMRGTAESPLPYLLNQCDDAYTQGIIYFIPDGKTKVKRLDENDFEPSIKLKDQQVRPHHATITSDSSSGVVSLSSADPSAIIWLNGTPVDYGSEPVKLRHGARLIFGNSFVFKYIDPRQPRAHQQFLAHYIAPEEDMKQVQEHLLKLDKSQLKRALSILKMEEQPPLPGTVTQVSNSETPQAFSGPMPVPGNPKEDELRRRVKDLESQLDNERAKSKACVLL